MVAAWVVCVWLQLNPLRPTQAVCVAKDQRYFVERQMTGVGWGIWGGVNGVRGCACNKRLAQTQEVCDGGFGVLMSFSFGVFFFPHEVLLDLSGCHPLLLNLPLPLRSPFYVFIFPLACPCLAQLLP